MTTVNMYVKMLKNHELRVEYYQMLAQIFFQEKDFLHFVKLTKEAETPVACTDWPLVSWQH